MEAAFVFSFNINQSAIAFWWTVVVHGFLFLSTDLFKRTCYLFVVTYPLFMIVYFSFMID